MVVTVNGRTMDITMEHERTLGDLLAGLEMWLENAGFSLSGLVVDGERVGLEAVEAACSRELAGIEHVDIGASTWAELMREALTETSAALATLLLQPEEARSVAAAWNASASASFLAGRDGELHKLVGRTLDGTVHDIEGTTAILTERIREIDDPRTALVAFVATLEPMVARLEGLPLDLQTGKDSAAAATLADFAVLGTKLFRLVPLLRSTGIDMDEVLIDGVGFRLYIEELGAALKELGAAYEGGDAVLVGDLAEYELAPRLHSLATTLERVLAPVA